MNIKKSLRLVPDRETIKPEPEPTDEEIEEELAEDNMRRDLWRSQSSYASTGASIFRGNRTGTNTD